jgi:predicted transcriptional regulator
MPDSPDLIGLTARLVAAYLRGNPMPTSELADFIRTTHAALTETQAPKAQPVAAQQPAVSVKKSITPGAMICLECGSRKQMLKRHLSTAHSLSVDDYRAKWSLRADYPMTAPGYASTRSDLAKKIGLGRKPAKAENEQPVGAQEAVEPQSGPKYPASRWSKPAS